MSSEQNLSRLKLDMFRFELNKKLIADRPLPNRDDSRMMVLDVKEKTIEHRKFSEFVNFFDEGDIVVVNNSKVFPARLTAMKEKTKAKIEVFLLRELNKEQMLWDILVDPARKIRIGNKLYFYSKDGEELVAEVIDNTTSRGRSIRFLFETDSNVLKEKLFKLGVPPLPHYIKRKPDKEDEERYQTIYAKIVGSVAAPTAGLHFTKNILKKMEIKGINFAEITLHVGLGTFKNLEVEDLSKHKMEAEEFIITKDVADKINNVILARKRVCAIGTTTTRALESSVSSDGLILPKKEWTSKFICPPYNVIIPNDLLTNFHLPTSPLLVLTSAFAGYEFTMHAYNEAIKEKYRFTSYGDCMLLRNLK